jgi:hypothetical protein
LDFVLVTQPVKDPNKSKIEAETLPPKAGFLDFIAIPFYTTEFLDGPE